MPQISLVKCQSYNQPEVDAAVKKAVDFLGGISAFVKPGQKVLLKPNLLSAQPPNQAITTHPAVVEAVIILVKGAGGIPLVGDSPAGAFKSLDEFWSITGMLDVCRRHQVELVSFEKSGVSQKEFNGKKYHIAKPVLDADVVINLPKLKTHSLTLMTGAVKNMYGVIPGLKKSMYHKQAPKPWDFSKLVADIYALARPHLNIVDAVTGLEGFGPSAGKPRQLGMILAGSDGVAVDALAAHLLGKKPLDIPTTKIAYRQNLGEADLKNVEVLGDRYDPLKDFIWPPNWFYSFIPGFLAKYAAKLFWVRPAIDPTMCINCGYCVESCPVSALASVGPVPEFNYKLCINCLCCSEVCPRHAVYQKRSPVAKLLGR
ncbi:DUF362 domain-containing protein [candidate division TA06 bacterium]|uniref:DUF362 domain-containing protein n=1 Tax=candidate division TA06 bacterium TaxID=2250710 RepID=A0A933MHK8_UNCT6|nr:DUF362 domain-containing protein [candidate division TA06 bacterium]